MLIAVVGLLVIGPEKLPTTIRTVALWVGRLKRSLTDARQEVERQLGADDIRRQLHNEKIMHNLEKMRDVHQDLKAKIEAFEEPASNVIEHSSHDEGEHHTQSSDQGDSNAPTEHDDGNRPTSETPNKP